LLSRVFEEFLASPKRVPVGAFCDRWMKFAKNLPAGGAWKNLRMPSNFQARGQALLQDIP